MDAPHPGGANRGRAISPRIAGTPAHGNCDAIAAAKVVSRVSERTRLPRSTLAAAAGQLREPRSVSQAPL